MNSRIHALVFSVIILLSADCVSAQDDPQFKILVLTDKDTYSPGDVMRLSVNITNIGVDEVLAKEIHAKVIAKSWFNLPAYKESRSYSRFYRVNHTRFGYIEVPIPSYTPLGKYEIQIWITYGSPESERQVVEEGDLESLPGKKEIEVDLGVIFLLTVLTSFGILLYVISSLTWGKRQYYFRVRPSVVEPHKPKPTDARIEYAIMVSLIFCIAISLIYVGNTKREKEAFSVLYVKPDSYSNYVKDNTFSFAYGVECFEKYPTNYDIYFYLGDDLIDSNSFELNAPGPKRINKIEETKVIHVPSDTQYPIKLRMVLKAWDTEYENIIWLRGTEEDEK